MIKRDYFDWAVDHYQMPFLRDIFFEQNLIGKTQWNEIKDLFDWTEEILPVAVWNNTIFIGCVEPPKKEVKFSDFEIRYVLTSYQSLKTVWKLVQGLSCFIEKEVTRSIARSQNLSQLNQELKSINSNLEPTQALAHKVKSRTQQSLSPDSPLDKPVKAVSRQSLKPDLPLEKPLDKPVKAVSRQSLKPDLPLEKPLDKPVKAVSRQSLKPDLPLEKPLDKPVKARPSMNLEKKAGFPEIEEERISEDNNTFPGRAPNDDNVLLMKNFKNKRKSASKTKLSDNTKLEESTKFKLIKTVDKTVTNVTFSDNYEDLWKYTKSFYCASIILKVKEDKVYPISWTGQVRLEKTADVFVDLDDYSLFKVVKKGYSYNGFVVDNPVNKKFFTQIGWKEYPKHVTAIPIKDSEKNLYNVFVGFSVKPLSRQKIQQIEESVLKFFHKSHTASQAA